jgi:head-tail adaptor
MRSGRRHSPIVVERGIDTPGLNGAAPYIVWQALYEVFAEVKEKLQRNTFEGGQRYEHQLYEFTCRFTDVPDILPKMRIRWNSQIYRIVGFVRDHERKRFTKITAELIAEDSRIPA